MARTLVLNATYEPICVVPCPRALVLVITDKAETIASTGRLIRSERLSLEEPSVVRRARFVRVPYQRRRALNRRAVFIRDGHQCQYCGAAAESILTQIEVMIGEENRELRPVGAPSGRRL